MALVPEQSNEVATAVAAPPALIERASELIRAHPECFWFRHPEARIRHLEDIRLVVEHLRELFPMLYITDQEVLARLCRQSDTICFCGCHLSEVDSGS